MTSRHIEPQVFNLDARDVEALRWAARIASRDPARAPLNSIYLDPRGRIVSTDGYRMLVRRTPALEGLSEGVIAGPAANASFPEARRGALTVSQSEVVLDCGTAGVSRLPVVRGHTYVEYDVVIPDAGGVSFRVGASPLGALIDGALSIGGNSDESGSDRPCLEEADLEEAELTLRPHAGTLSLAVRREAPVPSETSNLLFDRSVEVVVEPEGAEGPENVHLGVNAYYLSDALRALQVVEDDVVRIRLIGEGRPIVLSRQREEETLSVVMPVRLDRRRQFPEESVAEGSAEWGEESSRPAWRASRPVRRLKIGRNAPCPCGSGKKYKKCCMGTANDPALRGAHVRAGDG